jgi:hypothetical protein
VYEERRQESLKLMAETESKRAQIEDVVGGGPRVSRAAM